MAEEYVCRNCHEEGTPKHDLIAPCMCKGSVKFVHRSCLDTWRSVSSNPESFYRCDVCKFKYIIETQTEQNYWINLKFGLLVTRDLLAVLLVVNMIIIALGSVCQLIDPEAQVVKWVPSVHLVKEDWSPTAKRIVLIYECGGLLLLFITGLVGCCVGCNYINSGSIRERSYHSHNYPYRWYWGDCYFIYCGNCYCDTPHHHGGSSCGNCGNSGSCGNCDCKGDSNGLAILAIIVLVIVAIIILLGLFFGILAIVMLTTRIMKRHIKVLHTRKNATVMLVKDLNGTEVVANTDEIALDVIDQQAPLLQTMSKV